MQAIKNYISKLGAWWKRQRTPVKTGMILGVIIILFILLGKGGDSTVVVEEVKQQDLTQTISATGTVVSSTDLALSFQESNTVKSVSVQVGDKIKAGDVLASLNNASEAATVSSARGALLAAQARYQKTLQGVAGEEIHLAEVNFENTKRSQATLVASVRRKLFSDNLVAEDDAGSSINAPIITGTYNGIEEGEYKIEFYTSTNQIKYSGIEKGTTSVGASPSPLGTKGLLISFPDNQQYGFGDEWTIKIPNKDSASYTTNLNAYNDAISSAAAIIEQREVELELKKKTAPAEIDAALADVISAQGSLASAQAEFEKTIIRAPADGTITKVDLNIGDLVETFASVITLQDIENLYLEADVNESNVSNLLIGQTVSVTYDALGKNKLFSASVSSVDLAPTVVDGIVNYKIKALINDSSLIKPGMTANLSVQTDFVPNAVVIPDRVIKESNGEKTVDVIVDERKQKTEPRVVTTGLRGDGGLIEITSGLSIGEKILFTQK